MYKQSQIDQSNFKWFEKDISINSLQEISVLQGHIRGVFPMEVFFRYPISAFVGENGSGKSTLLALISCSFHNVTKFCPQSKQQRAASKERPYYTYGDFFTFHPSENGISEIQIKIKYLSSTGPKYDIRKKKPSGKWNDFNRRPNRVVSFLGINRLVPPSESSAHRHHSKHFSSTNVLTTDQTKELREALSRILGRRYSEIDFMTCGRMYRLFSTRQNGTKYTSFNMGAGENAVLGLLFEVIRAGRGALIVIDEIELGLHAKAQKQLVKELKQFCERYHCQIVCSTHSKTILDELPPEARFFVRRDDNRTDIIPEITSEYAFGQLSGESGTELKIFVEDEVGKAFVENSISNSIRERVSVIPIGSDQAVLTHLVVHYREKDYSFIAFLDGDKQLEKTKAIKQMKAKMEKQIDCTYKEFEDFFSKRLQYLPGNVWPEKYLIDEALKQDQHEVLCNAWSVSENEVVIFLEQASVAGKHHEFHSLSDNLHLSAEQVRADIVRFYKQTHNEDISNLERKINELLNIRT